MDANNWRAAEGQVMGREAVAAAGMEGGDSNAPLQRASQSMQPRMQNQVVQQLPMQMLSQELSSINIQNSSASTEVPNSAGLTLSLPTVASMSQDTMPVPAQNPNLQRISYATVSAVGHSTGQGIPADSHANAERKQVQAFLETPQTEHVSGPDWQEDTFQKLRSMYEMYSPELKAMHQRMATKLEQHNALPQQPKNEELEKLRFFKVALERILMFLQTDKNEIQSTHLEKISGVHRSIVNILSSIRPRDAVKADFTS